MSKSIKELVGALSTELEAVFQEGNEGVAELELPSGRSLVVQREEHYRELLADALAWRSFAQKRQDTMSPEDVLKMFN